MSSTADVKRFPVMQRQCATCPFRTDERGVTRCPRLVAKIQQRCLTEASQICHHPRLDGKAETHLCRGARDFQLHIFYQLGLLEALTDEAWAEAAKQMDTNTTP